MLHQHASTHTCRTTHPAPQPFAVLPRPGWRRVCCASAADAQQQRQQPDDVQQQQQQHHHHHQQQQTVAWLPSRRQGMLAVAAAVGCLATPTTASAAVTVTLRPKAQLEQVTLKAGFSMLVPSSWSLAYDRSNDQTQGTQAFFGSFKDDGGFETLSVLKVAKPPDADTPEQLLQAVLAEQRNNQSTFAFNLVSGDIPTRRDVDGDTFWDSEFELAICRGLSQEGRGGSRRCVGPRDMDLTVVSRSFFQTFVVRGSDVYIVRASSTTTAWPKVQPIASEAVQSFRLPPPPAA